MYVPIQQFVLSTFAILCIKALYSQTSVSYLLPFTCYKCMQHVYVAPCLLLLTFCATYLFQQ